MYYRQLIYGVAAFAVIALIVIGMTVAVMNRIQNEHYATWMRTCTTTAVANQRITFDDAFEHCKVTKEWLEQKEQQGWK